MRFADEDGAPVIRFGSLQEAAAFHLEVTDLLREAVVAAGAGISDPLAARARSQEVMKQYKHVLRMLNQMRPSLPRNPTG